MGLFDAFSYDGKRALVVGGATGMGAAAAELVLDAGAEVVVMDRAEVTLEGVKAIKLDLSDKASIEAAVDECGGPVHALFSCAGVADGTPGIERINFIGHRHMIDRLLAAGMLPPRLGHRPDLLGRRLRLGAEPRAAQRVPRHRATSTRPPPGRRSNDHADYLWTKLAINAYVAREAFALLKQGDPHQRHPPRPHRHAAGPGQRRHVARLRRRLPRGGRHRGLHAGRAGLPARVPVQRRGRRGHRHHDDHRRRLLLGRHQRFVPGRRRGPSSSCAASSRPAARAPRSPSSPRSTSGSGPRAPTGASGSRAATTAASSSTRRCPSARRAAAASPPPPRCRGGPRSSASRSTATSGCPASSRPT